MQIWDGICVKGKGIGKTSNWLGRHLITDLCIVVPSTLSAESWYESQPVLQFMK